MKTSSSFFRPGLLIFLVVALAIAGFAQVTQRDVIYLKNGSVIKGAVLEQIPDKTIKIQTADGSIFVFQMSEVERITKEGVPPPTGTIEPAAAEPARKSGGITLLAGGAMPVGKFANKTDMDGGMAKFGFVAGLEYSHISDGGLYFGLGGIFTMNAVDDKAVSDMIGYGLQIDATSWKLIVPTISLGFGSTGPATRFFFAGDFGYAIATSPEITVNSFYTIKQEAGSGSAPAFGGRIGIETSSRVSLTLRYLSTKPKYKFTMNNGGSTSENEAEQQHDLVMFILGIGL